MDTITFSCAAIIAYDDMQIVQGAALTVQDGRIVQIGEPVEGARQVELKDSLICPMFIDAHTHLGDTGAKDLGIGLPLADVVIPPNGLKHRFINTLDDDALTDMLRHGLQEMLHNGIIACGDFREQGLKGVRLLKKAAEGLPVRPVILGRMDEAAAPEEVERQAHALLQEADGLGIRDVTSYDEKLLQRLRRAYPGKIIAAHASENLGEEMDSRRQTGRSQADRLLDCQPDFLVHLIHTQPADLQRMAQMGAFGVSCPRSNGILGDGLPDLAAWAQSGVDFALGTDNMMFSAPDMLREMDFASRLGRGLRLDPGALATRQILQAATIQAARALKLERDLGSLAPGKEASFIVFNLNTPNLTYQHDPLSAVVHRATTADITAVWVKGIMESGKG